MLRGRACRASYTLTGHLFCGQQPAPGAGIDREALPPPVKLVIYMLAIGMAGAIILAAIFTVYTIFPNAGMPS